MSKKLSAQKDSSGLQWLTLKISNEQAGKNLGISETDLYLSKEKPENTENVSK